MERNKKSLSSVVTTVLLILITVAAFVTIILFIMPMIKDNLEKGRACFEMREQISIDPSYTCYRPTSTFVMVKRGLSNGIEIKGLVFSLNSPAGAQKYEFNDKTEKEGIRMYNGSSILYVPEAGGAETYNFSRGYVSFVEVVPVLDKGIVCDAISAEVNRC